MGYAIKLQDVEVEKLPVLIYGVLPCSTFSIRET